MEVITSKELWTAVSSLVLPPLIAIVQQRGWSEQTRAVVAFVCILIWTLLGRLYIGDDLPDWRDPRPVATLLFVGVVGAFSTYGHFWKPTGVAPAIERATTSGMHTAALWLVGGAR